MSTNPDAVADLYTLTPGDSPVLVNVPHAGVRVPAGVLDRFTDAARGLPDTDWQVDSLYAFAAGLGASLMVATHSRYVVDLNRPPDDVALYDTRTTGLVPQECFDGSPVYREGSLPDGTEIAHRRRCYWAPYHEALSRELERIRARHGHAVLLDAHSIRSQVPGLFEGRLPVFNLGSHSGASADPGLVQAAADVLSSDARWDLVIDARFKGGYITRHYGQPANGIHALQLEMAQRAYMDEDSHRIVARDRQAVQGVLVELVEALTQWRAPR